jgi:hypothetical protein
MTSGVDGINHVGDASFKCGELDWRKDRLMLIHMVRCWQRRVEIKWADQLRRCKELQRLVDLEGELRVSTALGAQGAYDIAVENLVCLPEVLEGLRHEREEQGKSWESNEALVLSLPSGERTERANGRTRNNLSAWHGNRPWGYFGP